VFLDFFVLSATSLTGLLLQEEYIKDETRNLKRELVRAKEVRHVPEKIHIFHLGWWY
jgi:hypothetical protein